MGAGQLTILQLIDRVGVGAPTDNSENVPMIKTLRTNQDCLFLFIDSSFLRAHQAGEHLRPVFCSYAVFSHTVPSKRTS